MDRPLRHPASLSVGKWEWFLPDGRIVEFGAVSGASADNAAGGCRSNCIRGHAVDRSCGVLGLVGAGPAGFGTVSTPLFDYFTGIFYLKGFIRKGNPP